MRHFQQERILEKKWTILVQRTKSEQSWWRHLNRCLAHQNFDWNTVISSVTVLYVCFQHVSESDWCKENDNPFLDRPKHYHKFHLIRYTRRRDVIQTGDAAPYFLREFDQRTPPPLFFFFLSRKFREDLCYRQQVFVFNESECPIFQHSKMTPKHAAGKAYTKQWSASTWTKAWCHQSSQSARTRTK